MAVSKQLTLLIKVMFHFSVLDFGGEVGMKKPETLWALLWTCWVSSGSIFGGRPYRVLSPHSYDLSSLYQGQCCHLCLGEVFRKGLLHDICDITLSILDMEVGRE